MRVCVCVCAQYFDFFFFFAKKAFGREVRTCVKARANDLAIDVFERFFLFWRDFGSCLCVGHRR